MRYLLLALLLGGCCSWAEIRQEENLGAKWWRSTKICDKCEMQKVLMVEDVPEHPEKFLYVQDNKDSCLIILRPAYKSDTGKVYRWDEIPSAFDCQ